MEENEYSDMGDEKSEDEAEAQLDPDNPDHAFAILERDFNKTLYDMEADSNTAHFAEEYNKLFENLYSERTKQIDWRQKCEHLEKELEGKGRQLDLAIEVTDNDKSLIEDLKAQINNAWRLADAAHAREQAAQEVIDNLRRQIENLNAEIDFRNKMAQDLSDDNLSNKNKEGLEREKERLIGEVSQLTQKLANALSYQEELERKNSIADVRIAEVAELLEDQKVETERIQLIRDKLEKDVEEVNSKVEEKDTVIEDLETQIKTHKREVIGLELQIKEAKVETEKLAREQEHTNVKLLKLQDDYDKSCYQLNALKVKHSRKVTDLKTAEDEVIHLKNDVARVSKARDQLDKRVLLLEHDKDELALDRNKLRQRFGVFEKEIEDLKRESDELKRHLEVLKKEKEIYVKTIHRNQLVAQDQATLFKLQEQTKKKLETELDGFFIEGNKQKKMIHTLERERDRLSEEQLLLKKKIEEMIDEMKLKKACIYDLKKSLAEQTSNLRMQQNMFEAIRADKNALQKALQESNAETCELKKKLKISTHQTEQLKEDIAMKEQLLVKEENILRKVMKEKENLRIEVDNGLEQIRTYRQEIAEMKEEQRRLHKVIMINERTIRQQSQDLDQLMNERDILGSQLVRRNDEIALLHEKILILETTLHRGEAQYDQRLDDIRLLKIEIKRLRQEKNLMSKSMNNMVDLRQEVFHLERDLTRARLKCRALEEEVQNPLNIHRWRKLEGSDPEVLDLLQKTQMLQKRLLRQTSEAVERERQLKEAEKLYMNLRQVLAKQPGPGIQEQLTNTQRALKLRGNKLKCLVSELNMAELQAAEYKSELQKVTEDLIQMKQKYLAERKAHYSLRMQVKSNKELHQAKKGSATATTDRNAIKYTGGGFRMAV